MKKMVQVLLLTLLTISSTGAAISRIPFQPGLLSASNPSGSIERRYGIVVLNVARDVRIEVDNRSTGRITIQGWDRDAIEAHAISARGDEVVIVDTSDSPLGKRFFLKADYADLETPSSPATRVLDSPPAADNGPLEIHLEVKVPRSAEIDQISVIRSNVEVSDIDTSIIVEGRHSSVILKRVGPVEVHTRSGTVEIEDAKGLVEVGTTSGAIKVSNARAAVHAVSIAGPIEIKCAHDRIDVANTDAPIELLNTEGDVDAVASNSSVRFTGDLREDRRYYLKSMSGRVEMLLPVNAHGFTATLSSYRGTVETDFSLKMKESLQTGIANRRVVGRYGNGKAQVTLDSFEGLVRLTKLAPGVLEPCRPEKSRN